MKKVNKEYKYDLSKKWYIRELKSFRINDKIFREGVVNYQNVVFFCLDVFEDYLILFELVQEIRYIEEIYNFFEYNLFM